MQDYDAIIMSIAARQHGIVARWQLVQAGVPVHFIEGRVKRRWLQRLHQGVYRVAPLAGPREREMAAVLSCGAAAVLSHRSAAAVFTSTSAADTIAVSVPGGHPRVRAGVRVYRVRLPAAETTSYDGAPVTTPARTLLDLAGIVASRELEQVAAHMLRQELTTEAELQCILQCYSRRAGASVLRQLLALDTPPALLRSEAEERFLALVRSAKLRLPVTNVRVRGFEVDFFWQAEKLVIEIDGMAYHSSRRAFARDRERDAILIASGLRVMRFTWADITERPLATAARVAQALVRGERE